MRTPAGRIDTKNEGIGRVGGAWNGKHALNRPWLNDRAVTLPTPCPYFGADGVRTASRTPAAISAREIVRTAAHWPTAGFSRAAAVGGAQRGIEGGDRLATSGRRARADGPSTTCAGGWRCRPARTPEAAPASALTGNSGVHRAAPIPSAVMRLDIEDGARLTRARTPGSPALAGWGLPAPSRAPAARASGLTPRTTE